MKHSVFGALAAVITKPTIAALGWEGVRKRLDWAARGSWLLLNPRTGLEIARLLRTSQMRPILRAEPRLAFKYLFGYLAMDLSRAERASMLIQHYALLQERAQDDFFSSIADGRLELWATKIAETGYGIGLSFPHTADGEGDLALYFRAGSVDIYILSFTIGPGSIAGLSAEHAMYIARVQGKGHGLDLIRKATRACRDVSPAMLLLAAAEGIAEALDLEYMVGIGAATQISTAIGKAAEGLVKAYDEFWTAAGAERSTRNMYVMPVPRPAKPILSVKRDHRSRTHRKRRFKKDVKDQVRDLFRTSALRPATRLGAPSAASSATIPVWVPPA